ncbi:ASCH domain-containing protein [Hyperthermus butylicus]|uniref:Conserved archaeal protein n=1 Tax=Hyperthermus butylicus (strain DSM 5456 / JCM 9403 / PLM1-5) TaxID=415426 RepID=A2BLF0_HYPBU|nr:ASCH domain-containing protein [Hyperthermus butylicus]ABM80811.1 conserved archaeal protein [Hyperthermus butylicus DSM 5456]
MIKEQRAASERSDKTKFLGRHLMVKGEYVDDILSGRKRATIRLGKVKVKYNELIVHGGGRPVAKVRVTNVIYKRVKELTDEDARKDGFRNLGELINALRKVYGEVKPDDYVTIIEFEVVQDLTSLEPQDPYLGLEPADIARLALRYLGDMLSDDEKKILKDLTSTNSIRATAVRLFGSIERRWRVRKVLRRALSELVRQGLLSSSSSESNKQQKYTTRGRHGRKRR